MSATNYGISSAPIGTTATTATTPFTNPVIPTPIPSAGAAKGFSTLPNMTQGTVANPILDAAAGPKFNIIWVENVDEILNHPTSPN